MCTLYLNLPKSTEEMGSTPFEKTEATGIGVRFYIHQTSLPKLFNGMPVVIVRKDGKKKERARAEGTLNKWVQCGYTEQNPPRLRYNIYIDGLTRVVPYVPLPVLGTFRDDGGGVLIECADKTDFRAN